MSILPMFRQCIHCGRAYSCSDPAEGMICPYCRRMQLRLPRKRRFPW